MYWAVLALVIGAGRETQSQDAADAVLQAPAAFGSGSLVICGGADIPAAALERFVELAGGKRARIVVITSTMQPDAVQEEVDEWLELLDDDKVASVEVLHTRSHDRADEESFVKPLREATGVWFTGGNQAVLSDTYLGTRTETELRSLLAREGVIGGISAGAAVMSQVMIRGGGDQAEIGEGFGFLPGAVIDQHFLVRNRQARLMSVLEKNPNLFGLGIDEGSALIIEGRRISVVGSSHVVVCMPGSDEREEIVRLLKDGDEDDLILLGESLISKLVTEEMELSSSEEVEDDEDDDLFDGRDLVPDFEDDESEMS
ncbi:MAG: cyanophycinase [Planctomycetales bacterium]|nr:cyanophycinase [Planctomycetales bacterium]